MNSYSHDFVIFDGRRIALVLLLMLSSLSVESKIICDLEMYVRFGIEYRNCLLRGLQEIPDRIKDPCPLLRKTTISCAELTKQCFDDRGWDRMVQASVDNTVLVYQEKRKDLSLEFCHLFNATNVSDGNDTFLGVPQKLPGELCTIREEAILIEKVDACKANKLNNLLQNLVSSSRSLRPPPKVSIEDEYRLIMCKELQGIYDDCIRGVLRKCVSEGDIPFYETFLLEGIKRGAIIISNEISLTGGNDRESRASAIVTECPVFLTTYKNPFRNGQPSEVQTLIGIYAGMAVLALVATGLILGILFTRLRLAERIRALLQKKPYEEFAIPETRDLGNSGSI